MTDPDGFVPLSQSLPFWPGDLFGQPDFLDQIGFRDYHVQEDTDLLKVTGTLVWFRELAFELPGLKGFSIAFLSANGHTAIPIEVDVRPDLAIRLRQLNMAFRMQTELLKPVKKENGRWVVMLGENGQPKPAELEFGGVDVEFDLEGNIDILMPAGAPQIGLGPVQIGDTGIVLEIHGVVPFLSGKQAAPVVALPGFRGFTIKSLKVYLPDDLDVPLAPDSLNAQNVVLGTGGLSGTIGAQWGAVFQNGGYTGSGAGTLFGIPFGLKSLEVTFKQNIPTAFAIKGEILLPFFDHPVKVRIAIGSTGNFTVALDSGTTNGLYKLTKDGILEIELDSIGFELKDGVFMAKLSGQITPLFGGLNWPGFKVEELSIDSKGHIHLQGGWLALREQYSVDFHGFHLGITKIGFGKKEDGGKWIGFSGELKLVDGFTAGASVEGLRVTWYDGGTPNPKVTFEGIGVEFEIPDVLYFKGAVSYRELEVEGASVHRFDGDIKLSLISLGLEIDAKLVVGSASGGPEGNYNFFAIYLGVELPTGIPLSPTPLALFGMAGLFALQMEPNKAANEEWYEGWYKRNQVGVTDLKNKWVNRRGSMAIGFGGTFGTSADDGFTVAVKALLVIVFPGPIILLSGRANLLKERAKLSDEAMFEALAVLDMREGQILIGLDAKYKQDEQTGKVIDIRASAEAFFKSPDNWHVYMGKREPRTKRIRARILNLFEANSYFMIDPKQLATGAWVGYAKQWKFGPVGLTLEAWIEGNVVVNWTPLHFHGDLWLHGNVEVKLFGFGLRLSLDARFEADVFDPFHVKASFEVTFKPPKPFKKPKHFEITLEWGPIPDWPKHIPLPLQEVAIEHFKVTTSWPLSKDGTDNFPPLLAPKYDFEERGLRDYGNAPSFVPPSLGTLPVVPLDCRPHISFGRPVHDDALVGVNPQPPHPAFETIGDSAKEEGPVKVRYALKKIELFKWNNQIQDWQTVAVKGRALNNGERTLYGSWAPVPQLPSGNGPGSVANVKLWLWSKTPFDYTRHGGSGVDDWFVANFPNYPCVPQDLPDREVCCDFERLGQSQILETPWRSPEHPEITLAWQTRTQRRVTALDPPVNGFTRALCFPVAPPPFSNSVMIDLSAPAKRVKLVIVEKKKSERICLDFRTRQRADVTLPHTEAGVTIGWEGTIKIALVPTTLGDMMGLNVGLPAQPARVIILPCSATSVELMLSYLSAVETDPNFIITALNSRGEQISVRALINPQRQPEIVHFEAEDLKQIKISSSSLSAVYLHQLCFVCPVAGPSVTATGFNAEGSPTGTFGNRGNEIEVFGDNLTRVQLNGNGEICILKICALFGPDPVDVAHRQEMAAHLQSEVARWQNEGEVLEPFSAYRLTITTAIDAHGEGKLVGSNKQLSQVEHAYFRTEGPPGLTKLSLPPGRPPADADKFDSGLEDLTRYVRQTIPATIPGVGEKPVMAKPFYRAYDIGVEFNEDYVDLMYRISGRDLGVYLYDSNNRPTRDVEGRLLVQSGDWGTVEELTLTEGEQRWLALSNSENHCLPVISTETIAHDKKLTSALAGRVLEPDTVHEARLIPLLLREGFQKFATGAAAAGPSGSLGRWRVHDEGNVNFPSQWEVAQTVAPVSKYVTQTSQIKGGNEDPNDPVKPGTILLFGNDPGLDSGHQEQPTEWTDYRLSVHVSAAGGAIGLVFRHRDNDNYYRFSMGHNHSYRRFVSVVEGFHTVLGQDDFAYELLKDYLFTIEAIGDSLRVYQDGALIFEATDAAHPNGSFGLYCYDNAGARFSDVSVDDFRQTAPVVYRFQFTTSRFANFYHHLHSYQDETWRLAVEQVPEAVLAMLKAVTPFTSVTDVETRAYETLATAVLGTAARQNPAEVQVTQVEIDEAPLAFLVQSPEPIDWLRTDIAFWKTSLARSEPGVPGRVKLAAVNFAANRIDIDSVVLLLREPLELTGYRIEGRLATWPLSPGSGVAIDAQTLLDGWVDEHSWTTYRTFDSQKKSPAGTTLQIQPVDAAPFAPPGLVGVDAETVAPARRIFYSIELRIVAPDGKIMHARHFLPNESHVPEDVRVLRKADGTGFFMLRAGADDSSVIPFSLGQYRLKLIYHRNNKNRVPTSTMWSQAGDAADEIVTLDIPPAG